MFISKGCQKYLSVVPAKFSQPLSDACGVHQEWSRRQKLYEGAEVTGIYGTIRTSSLASIFAVLASCGIDDTDVFCDIGFGLGG